MGFSKAAQLSPVIQVALLGRIPIGKLSVMLLLPLLHLGGGSRIPRASWPMSSFALSNGLLRAILTYSTSSRSQVNLLCRSGNRSCANHTGSPG